MEENSLYCLSSELMQLNSGIQVDFRLMLQFQRLWMGLRLRLEFVKLWA